MDWMVGFVSFVVVKVGEEGLSLGPMGVVVDKEGQGNEAVGFYSFILSAYSMVLASNSFVDLSVGVGFFLAAGLLRPSFSS